jgi:hypothetical protein
LWSTGAASGSPGSVLRINNLRETASWFWKRLTPRSVDRLKARRHYPAGQDDEIIKKSISELTEC